MDRRTITLSGQKRAKQPEEAAYLFLALQCHRPLGGGARFCLAGTTEVTIGRGDAVSPRAEGAVLRIEMDDGHLSSRHLRISSVLGGWFAEDLGSKNGTRVDGAPIGRVQLSDGATIEAGGSFFIFRDRLPRMPKLSPDLAALAPRLSTLLPQLAVEIERLPLIARARLPILLRGETGTGKEVVAQAIHRLSGREGSFVPVNCGALPATLLESELFGYRKGAFSGAAEDRLGLIRSADKGTLLLDELGDLPLPAQAALLRVLQEEEVVPVGGTRALKLDLRVIAATHRDLEAMVSAGTFRADLLARVSGYVVKLPALRERREDLGVIIAALLSQNASWKELALARDTGRALLGYRWPGNVRELEKCLSAAAVLAVDGIVETDHLPPSLHEPPEAPRPAERLSEADLRLREALIGLLRAHDGNVTAAARSMGKARTQVQRWLRRFGIDPLTYRR